MEIHSLEARVGEHPFCRGLRPETVALLSGCAANRRYDPGDLLFRAGEAVQHTWLLRSGRVVFEVHDAARGALPIETAEEGELVGWTWLFPGSVAHFDARAVGVVRAFELDGACLYAKCEADPAFGFEVIRRILETAHRRLERSRVSALDVYAAPTGRSGTT